MCFIVLSTLIFNALCYPVTLILNYFHYDEDKAALYRLEAINF